MKTANRLDSCRGRRLSATMVRVLAWIFRGRLLVVDVDLCGTFSGFERPSARRVRCDTVRALVERGLAELRAIRPDERSRRLVLTPDGEAVARAAVVDEAVGGAA